jgi:hypothetical protein
MKTIVLTIASILLLLLSNISFGQRIEWWAGSNPYVIHESSHVLGFQSPDGRFWGEFRLLPDGRTLKYEVTVNVGQFEIIDEFSIYAQVDEYTTAPAWWDILYTPFPYNTTTTFSGSYYLNYTEPQPFCAMVECLFVDAPNVGFWVFPTYYPE